MDKDTFYNQLHQNLADKYGLTPNHVRAIRGRFSQGISREELGRFYVDKMNSKIPNKNRCKDPQSHFPKIVAFILKATDEQWADLIQKTAFDKETPGSNQPGGV